MDIVLKYFPDLSGQQIDKFNKLEPLYRQWNSKINLISRKDIENLGEKHILHSLAIAKFLSFKDETEILDLGTGGGFPGIPLAILFPECQFFLIDGTLKKIKVVKNVIESLRLKNVDAQQFRAEELKNRKYDFVVSRAVAKMNILKEWSLPLIKSKHKNNIPNGLIALKGGDLKSEMKGLSKRDYIEKIPVSDFFEEEIFIDKFVVYIQL